MVSRGDVSVGAGVALAMRVLLLVTIAKGTRVPSCPDHCYCADDKYTCSNGAVTVMWADFRMTYALLQVACTVRNITCSDLPQIKAQADKLRLASYACPLSIIGCMKHVVPGLWLDEVRFSGTYERRASVNLSDVRYVKKLYWELSESDTSLAVDEINTWHSLRFLKISGGKLQLSPNYFNLSQLRELHLKDNNINRLPAGCFNGLPRLTLLKIESNNIEHISAGAFRGLDHLDELILQSIELKTIEVDTFADTLRLRRLIIAGNPLQLLPDRLLAGLSLLEEVAVYGKRHQYHAKDKWGSFVLDWTNVFSQLELVTSYALNISYLPEHLFHASNNIQKIMFRGDNLKTFPLKIFSNLSFIDTIDLAYNSIESLYDGVFGNLNSLKILNLSHNSIRALPDGIFSALISVWDLNLSCNNIHELPELVFANMTSLSRLNLSDNKILMLPDKILNNSIKLWSLDLSNNVMEEVTVFSFFGLKRLHYLYLRNNKINYIHTMSFEGPRDEVDDIMDLASQFHINLTTPISPFQILSQLVEVDLSGNRLRRLFNGWERNMRHITKLNLSSNEFTVIQEFTTNYSSLNIEIDLRRNNVTDIVLDTRLSSSNGSLPAASSLTLDAPIICDCNSFGLYLRTAGARLSHEPHYVLNGSTCIAPPHLKGQLFKDVPAQDLNCNLSKHCPSNCSSCVARSATNEVIIACPTIPHTLPDLRSDDFPYHYFVEPTITLQLHHQPQDISHLNIHTLNLTNTGIREITFQPTDSLRILDVSRNKLATIPNVFFERNITLYISNNPLSCDCAFIKKLNHDRVADLDHVVCTNEGKFNDIDGQELCNRNIALVGFICTGLICSIFSLKIGFAIYKHVKKNWIHILRPFLSHSEYTTTLEKRLDAAKEFDLFISFAHEDTPFVRDTLLPKLEKDYNQKVCVHSRDWIAGDLIADQIIQSVGNARRTIIILTEHFISSEWSYLEFRTAHNLSTQEGKPRVIMILLKEDIANNERLSRDIKSYIAINTYLLWDDPNFWEKLKQVLPRRGRK